MKIFTQAASSLPLLCKEGRGEVEARPRTAPLLFERVALPHLTSPYKGEEKSSGAARSLGVQAASCMKDFR